MVTENYESKNIQEKLGKISVSVGKPDKDNRRNISVEFTVSMLDTDTEDDYNKRYSFFKEKALGEL